MSRALKALILLLAAAPAVAPAAAAHDPLQVIDGCLRQLDPELDVGFEKIAARCPELAPSLAHSPWSAWLPSDWDKAHNGLAAGGLRELRALIVAESARPAAARAPDVSHVAAVLGTLATPAPRHDSWWQRVKAWLHEMLTARGSAAGRSWLSQLVEALGQHGPWFGIAIGALALVALLAATLLLGGLRGAGLLRWRRPASARGAAAQAGERIAPWRLIEMAAPLERPRLLLELIAVRLAEQDRLPPARALTVHELLRAAQLADADDRARLAELTAACERLRFSGRRLPAHELSVALERGRELLDGLGAARA
ncbi:MAG: DUF4129 domain-containing protein [Steroidobacteraceae bacterium]